MNYVVLKIQLQDAEKAQWLRVLSLVDSTGKPGLPHVLGLFLLVVGDMEVTQSIFRCHVDNTMVDGI
jgi:hypothetical protein